MVVGVGSARQGDVRDEAFQADQRYISSGTSTTPRCPSRRVVPVPGRLADSARCKGAARRVRTPMKPPAVPLAAGECPHPVRGRRGGLAPAPAGGMRLRQLLRWGSSRCVAPVIARWSALRPGRRPGAVGAAKPQLRWRNYITIGNYTGTRACPRIVSARGHPHATFRVISTYRSRCCRATVRFASASVSIPHVMISPTINSAGHGVAEVGGVDPADTLPGRISESRLHAVVRRYLRGCRR